MATIGRAPGNAVLTSAEIAANTVQASDLNSTWYSSNSHIYIPAGTSSDRPSSPVKGHMRYNGQTGTAEIYDGSTWGSVGGGATGGGQDAVFLEFDQTVSTSYSVTSSKNALTAGPITIADGVAVTIPTGSVWTIV